MSFIAGFFWVSIAGVLLQSFISFRNRKQRWLLALLFPCLISYLFYWIPAWQVSSAEFQAWQYIFIIPWTLAGMVTSSISIVILDKRSKK